MSRIVVRRTVAAPVARVFRAITDVEGLPDRDPAVSNVEFLSEQRSGAGTRFRETRASGKREVITELEITELVENQYARFVSDMGGTVWDTKFSTLPAESPEETELEIALDARPHAFLAKMLNPLANGMIRSGMEKHIEGLKKYCETKSV